ncbi:ribonuclease P protein component [Tsukamurella ocularis]|uniref:ribonuclease P protein component n=1 Tax=Tsukamurella ocularis TaxID=1970234 RepID=UPI002167FB6D|nr:ribonuclease P protein component [Tsukamurella ocularis]MCS3779289.1 ribonuclease P protein component [Tsukamurella ocularis]MCS3787091.1 ribonuclease P protein component [Tsukamurella ocularis]MCS3852482.1 ribonuclease P protein component [Tsukamurella ocularis]
MLPARYRMSSSRDFAAAVKGGRRVGRRSIVVHVATSTKTSPVPASEGGPGVVVSADDPVTPAPRIGLVVSKAVGNAVIRHSVARRLRAAVASVAGELDDGALVVVRALRAAADDDANELTAQLRSGLTKLGAL